MTLCLLCDPDLQLMDLAVSVARLGVGNNIPSEIAMNTIITIHSIRVKEDCVIGRNTPVLFL